MVWLLLFIVAIFIGAIVVLVNQARNNKKIKQEAIDRGAYDGVACKHIEGLGIGDKSCNIFAFENEIQIEAANKSTFRIPIERVRAFVTKSQQEFEDVDRSVVGRAVVGTLLVPGLGTIVGGMSGLKNKKKKKGGKSFYLIINYVDASGELKGVTFQDDLNITRLTSFTKTVNDKLSSQSYGQVIDL